MRWSGCRASLFGALSDSFHLLERFLGMESGKL